MFTYVREWQDERISSPTRLQFFFKFVTDMHFKTVRERKKKNTDVTETER